MFSENSLGRKISDNLRDGHPRSVVFVNKSQSSQAANTIHFDDISNINFLSVMETRRQQQVAYLSQSGTVKGRHRYQLFSVLLYKNKFGNTVHRIRQKQLLQNARFAGNCRIGGNVAEAYTTQPNSKASSGVLYNIFESTCGG
jgi:hypothetical protein